MRLSIRRLYPDIAEQKTLWAACTFAFFGFLHSSEYTTPSTVKFHRKVTLQLKDVTLQKSKMLIRIKGSKTDLFRKAVTLTTSKTGSFVCPVHAMKKYLPAHPSKTGPLFQTLSRGYLTRSTICKLLKETLKSSGIDTTRYSSHSFRIGAATTAAVAGISDRIINALGRW